MKNIYNGLKNVVNHVWENLPLYVGATAIALNAQTKTIQVPDSAGYSGSINPSKIDTINVEVIDYSDLVKQLGIDNNRLEAEKSKADSLMKDVSEKLKITQTEADSLKQLKPKNSKPDINVMVGTYPLYDGVDESPINGYVTVKTNTPFYVGATLSGKTRDKDYSDKKLVDFNTNPITGTNYSTYAQEAERNSNIRLTGNVGVQKQLNGLDFYGELNAGTKFNETDVDKKQYTITEYSNSDYNRIDVNKTSSYNNEFDPTLGFTLGATWYPFNNLEGILNSVGVDGSFNMYVAPKDDKEKNFKLGISTRF
ncbi:MAG: hypothetical protein AB7V77_03325 [Candidatus Woesearchaeota archaeon]